MLEDVLAQTGWELEGREQAEEQDHSRNLTHGDLCVLKAAL